MTLLQMLGQCGQEANVINFAQLEPSVPMWNSSVIFQSLWIDHSKLILVCKPPIMA